MSQQNNECKLYQEQSQRRVEVEGEGAVLATAYIGASDVPIQELYFQRILSQEAINLSLQHSTLYTSWHIWTNPNPKEQKQFTEAFGK